MTSMPKRFKNKMTQKILLTLLVFGIVLLGGGLYASQTFGYEWSGPANTNERFNLGLWLYYQNPNEERVYLGDFLGVYSVGTKLCVHYDVTTSGGNPVLNCPDTGWASLNGWGVLFNGFQEAEGFDPVGELVPAQIYSLIPRMVDPTPGQPNSTGDEYLEGYTLAVLDGSDGATGHNWSAVNQYPAGLSSASRIGVELVLHPSYEYPTGQLHDLD